MVIGKIALKKKVFNMQYIFSFKITYLIYFIIYVPFSLFAQSEIIIEEEDFIETEELIYDSTDSERKEEKIIVNNKLHKIKIGMSITYPFIHGGDEDIKEFWQVVWDGIFGTSIDFQRLIVNKLRIGAVVDFSLYKLDGESELSENAFIMLITSFTTRYDLFETPNKSILITPFFDIGLAANCFYIEYYKGDWSNDLGLLFSFGFSTKIRLPNDLEIGPIIRYDIIRRFYDLSDGEKIDKDWGIVKIKTFRLGMKVNFPIKKSDK